MPNDQAQNDANDDDAHAYMTLANLLFTTTANPKDLDANTRAKKILAARKMAYLANAHPQLISQKDADTYATQNAEALHELDDKIKIATENEGESEQCAALLAKADFLMKVGEKETALAAYDAAYAKTVGLGPRLDVLLTKLRLGFFHGDRALVSSLIETAKAALDDGGDWERRNRLKVYEAVHLISIRSFEKAAALLLDSLATFTATELLSYETFVLYTVLTSAVSLSRAELKKKVIDSPEVLQVIDNLPHATDLLNGLYSCQYRRMMRALVGTVDETFARDRYLHEHGRYYWREMRVLAYTQFLESYRSVSLGGMADVFGFSTEFLDGEISAFIASNRLSCKIDKVSMIVTSTRPDKRNGQYRAVLKEGDILLNRLQKLSRVISM